MSTYCSFDIIFAGVAQLINKVEGAAFDDADDQLFEVSDGISHCNNLMYKYKRKYLKVISLEWNLFDKVLIR